MELTALAIVELRLLNVLARRCQCLIVIRGFGVESRQLVGRLQMLRGQRGSFFIDNRTLVQLATDSWSTSHNFILDRNLLLQSFKE